MTRLGYYVEDKFFGGKAHQASSFAQFRANEYGRPVDVTFVGHNATSKVVVATLSPEKQPQVA